LVKTRSSKGIAKGVKDVFNGKYLKKRAVKFGLKENIDKYLNVYRGLNG